MTGAELFGLMFGAALCGQAVGKAIDKLDKHIRRWWNSTAHISPPPDESFRYTGYADHDPTGLYAAYQRERAELLPAGIHMHWTYPRQHPESVSPDASAPHATGAPRAAPSPAE